MPLSDEQMSALMTKQSQPTAALSDEQMSAMMQGHQSGDIPSATRSFSDNMANTAAFGYVPQIVGGITKALSPPREDITSSIGLRPDIAAKPNKNNISYNPYLIGRDTTNQDLRQEQGQHPTASLAGSLTGAIGSGAILPLPKVLNASSIMGGVTKGAAVGAGYGAIANPGDTEGQIDPLQLDARKENAIHGAEIGAFTGGVTQGVSKGLKAIANSPESLQGAANAQSVKASGAMLKDLRALEGVDKTDALGKFALDKGLVKAGDTFEDVGNKAENLRQDAGKRLDQIYSQAKAAIPQSGETPNNIGFNPIRDKSKILSQVSSQLGDQVGAKSAVTAVSNYLDELGTKYGDKVLDPKTANNIESAVSKKVNFLRNPLTAQPEAEQGFSTVRKVISDAVDKHIEYLGKATGDDEVAAKLAEANKDYGFSTQISHMAQDKANRVAANSKFGLLDTISAGSGAVAGTIAGEEMGGHPVEGGLLGLGAGVLSHFARGHGDAILASGLNRAGQAMRYGPSQAAAMAGRSINPNLLSRAAIQSNVINGQSQDKSLQQDQPSNEISTPLTNIPQSPTQKRGPATVPNQSVPSPGANPGGPMPQTPNDKTPSAGKDKWALDGFHNLRNHADDDERQVLDDNKEKMLLTPKIKNLLVTASSFPPGSKPLDQIMTHVKNHLGEK